MAPLLSTATALTPLLLLACPIGMGAMMFFMMRGSGTKTRESEAPSGSQTSSESEATSVAELKAEHARLAEQIEQLERSETADRTPAER